MSIQRGVVLCIALACVRPGQAADVPPGRATETLVSTTTITASAVIAPGRYVFSVAPNFNSAMGKRLETALAKLPGLSEVVSNDSDSSLHITVNEKSKLQLSDIQKIVKTTDNGAVMTALVLQGSLKTPGL